MHFGLKVFIQTLTTYSIISTDVVATSQQGLKPVKPTPEVNEIGGELDNAKIISTFA